MFQYETYCLENEIWKPIPDYEKLYEASNLGRIRSIDGKVTQTKYHGLRRWSGKILKNKTKIPCKEGYKVSLWKENKTKDHLVARLVCSAFYGIPNNYYSKDINLKPTVNHKDGNRFNNKIENLEWLSLSENIKHGFQNDLYPQHKTILKNLKTKEFYEFKSKSKASVFLGRNEGYISGQIKRNQKIKNSLGDEFEVMKCIPF